MFSTTPAKSTEVATTASFAAAGRRARHRNEARAIVIFAACVVPRRRVVLPPLWMAAGGAGPALQAPAGLAPGRPGLAGALWEPAPPPALVAQGPARPVLAAELDERRAVALAAAPPQEALHARAVSLAPSRDCLVWLGHAVARRRG
jgi:hypothetical protein